MEKTRMWQKRPARRSPQIPASPPVSHRPRQSSRFVKKIILSFLMLFFLECSILIFYIRYTHAKFNNNNNDNNKIPISLTSFDTDNNIDDNDLNDNIEDDDLNRFDFDHVQEGNGYENDTQYEEYEDNELYFNYSIPAIRNSETIPFPNMINNTANKIVVLVMSRRCNYEKRKVIRATWGKISHKILFLIGGDPSFLIQNRTSSSNISHSSSKKNNEISFSSTITDNDNNDNGFYSSSLFTINTTLTLLLKQEQKEYNDLIDCIHPESYHSLPYKLKFGFQYIVEQLSPRSQQPESLLLSKNDKNNSIQWIIKVDDDTYVRSVDNLDKYVLSKFDHNNFVVIGDIVTNSAVARYGKWKEDQKYKEDYYPCWPRGSSGYVVSYPIVQYITSKQNRLHYYQGEDTSLGIWLDENRLHTNTTTRIIRNEKILSMNAILKTIKNATTNTKNDDDDDDDDDVDDGYLNVCNKYNDNNKTNVGGIMWIRSSLFAFQGYYCNDTTKMIIGHNFNSNDIRSCYEQQTSESERILL